MSVSAPDTFFLRFEQAPWSDPCFMSLGRLLALSQRVESLCRSLALYIKLRIADPSPLGSEDTMQVFCDAVWKQKLHEHVTYVSTMCASERELFGILDAARIARNEVAHEIALGFEHWAFDESLSSSQSKRIRELATALARADHVLCLLDSAASHEPMPRGELLRTYEDRLVSWVCDTDNGEPW